MMVLDFTSSMEEEEDDDDEAGSEKMDRMRKNATSARGCGLLDLNFMVRFWKPEEGREY